MKTFRRILTGSLLLPSLLMACQGINQQQSGALSFRVHFPERSFQTLQIPEQTKQIGLAVFEEQASRPLTFKVLTRQNAHVLMASLPVGPKEVMAFAVDADIQILSGALKKAEVESGGRSTVELDLATDWQKELNPEQLKALEHLLDSMRLPVPEHRQVELSCGPLKKRSGFSIQSNQAQNTRLLLSLEQSSFQTQLVPPQTQYIGIAAMNAKTQELLSLKIVSLNHLQVLLKNLPIGELEIFAFTLDEKLNPLTGSLQIATIDDEGQGSVDMTLEAGFEGKLEPTYRQLFKALISTLNNACEPRIEKEKSEPKTSPKPNEKPSPDPSTKPSPQPSPELSPEPTVDPSPQPTIEPSKEPQPSTEPSAEASATASTEPSAVPSSHSGGGGSSGPRAPIPTPTPTPEVIDVGNGGGNIGTDITIEDGSPSPPPITVSSF